MNQHMSDLQQALQEITQGKSMEIETLVVQLKGFRRYRNTPNDVLRRQIQSLEQQNEVQKETESLNNAKGNSVQPNQISQADLIWFYPIDFEDLGGYTHAKEKLKYYTRNNIIKFSEFNELGFKRSRKHLLISGPQLVGKASMALAVAKYSQAPYVKINLFDSRISSQYSTAKLNQFLSKQMQFQPCIVILENIDEFFDSDKNKKDQQQQIITQFNDFFELTQKDKIFLIATCAQPKSVPKEFLGLNKFETHVQLDVPSEEDREEILEKIMTQYSLKQRIQIEKVIPKLSGYVAGDLKNLLLKTGEICVHKNEKFLTTESMMEATKEIQPMVKQDGFTDIPQTTFEQIGALQELKQQLENQILAPLKYPDLCERFGLKKTAGILLYGPPGCGKTMLAKAISNACQANFIYVKGPELLNKYFGESEKSIWDLFQRARQNTPCLIFFDEIDGMCPKRSSEGNQVIERVVNQLLTELNGVDNSEGLFIIGATNRPDIIDTAVLRPERLGLHLYVPLPSEQDWIDILNTIIKKWPIDNSLTAESLCSSFDLRNYSGADLNSFVENASKEAAWGQLRSDFIEMAHFQWAFKHSKASLKQEDLEYYAYINSKFK